MVVKKFTEEEIEEMKHICRKSFKNEEECKNMVKDMLNKNPKTNKLNWG